MALFRKACSLGQLDIINSYSSMSLLTIDDLEAEAELGEIQTRE